MTSIPLRCAHCGSNAVIKVGRDSFRCEHCGAEGPAIRKPRPPTREAADAGRW